MINEVIYLGMGANLGDSFATLCKAAEAIALLPFVTDIQFSRLYKTSPVDAQPPDFLNAACRFSCGLDPFALQKHLEEIEKSLGKLPKSKQDARMIDLDILFYGIRTITTEKLIIPHPRWQERLFVLYPLRDLTKKISLKEGEVVDLDALIDHYKGSNQKIEKIQPKIKGSNQKIEIYERGL